MKKILITGENSYIGTSFKTYLETNYPNQYHIDEISVKDDDWKSHDFNSYEIVLHVAGIAHIKETKNNQSLYYKVNRDLAIEIARKAKNENIGQFIFLSSMSVYGVDRGEIKIDTPTLPKSAYGKSKLEAEQLIQNLSSNNFKIAIIRPPMVYGPKSTGNYTRLSKLTKVIPIFPQYPNQRSMIFIDNLSMFIKSVIDNKNDGIYLPQNNEYVNTSNMVLLISKHNNKKIFTTKIFNFFIKKLLVFNLFNKIFGDLIYEKGEKLNQYISFEESIKMSENGKINEK